MGYAAVVHLRDALARTADDAALGGELLALVNGDSYPVGGLSFSAGVYWSRVGAYHSSELAVICADEQAAGREAIEHAHDGCLGWSDEVTVSVAHRRTCAILHNPAQVARCVGDVTRAVYGDNTALLSVASVWWVYLDHLEWHTPTAEALGGFVKRCLTRQVSPELADEDDLSSGFRRAGWLVSGGEATLVWSGNRLAPLEGLEARERAYVDERISRRALT